MAHPEEGVAQVPEVPNYKAQAALAIKGLLLG